MEISTDAPRPEPFPRRLILIAIVLFCAVFLGTIASSERYPLTWDEGDAFNRAEQETSWFEAFFGGGGTTPDAREPVARSASRRFFREYEGSLFSRPALEAGFPHATCREGHPAGCSHAIAAGRALSSVLRAPWSEKTSRRSGQIFLFSLAVAAVFFRVGRLWGVWSGLVSVAAIIVCPRVFAHAQTAGGDSLLISSWLLAWSLWGGARRSAWRAALWGCVVGLSFSAKFSGFLVVLPFAFAEMIEWLRTARRLGVGEIDWRPALRAAFGVCLALLLFYAVNPTLWARPVSGFADFWTLNTRREGFDIPIYFFGKFYSPSRPAPWWNGFFWLIATVPIPVMALGLASLFSGRNGRAGEGDWSAGERFRALTSGFGLLLVLPAVRCFPGLPVHDGARLLISSCAFWGALAGPGATVAIQGIAGVLDRAFKLQRSRGVLCGIVAVCALLTVGAIDLVGSAPQYLSFYGGATGGICGAVRLGLEPTYYWDGFDAESVAALAELRESARREGRPSGVLFGSFSSQTLEYYALSGTFGNDRAGTISDPKSLRDPSVYGFYVLQRRPGGLTPGDVAFIKTSRPLFQKRVRDPLLLERGAVVLEIYDFGEALKTSATGAE